MNKQKTASVQIPGLLSYYANRLPARMRIQRSMLLHLPKPRETICTVPDPNGSFEGWVVFIEQDVSDYCPSPVPYNGPAYYYPGCPDFYAE